MDPAGGVLDGASGERRPDVAVTLAQDPGWLTVRAALDRELVRQALLIAARDGLGLFTRDDVLGENLPVDLAGAHMAATGDESRHAGSLDSR